MTAHNASLKLRTIKKISSEVGISQSYIKQLLREKKLNRFKIGSATYVSLSELEKLASETLKTRQPY
jgi:hypothetical protein